MTAQFEGIYLSAPNMSLQPGKLRIAQSGLGWKSSDETEQVTTIPGSDIKWIQWMRVARQHQLRIGTPKSRYAFDGFMKDDFERLSNLCKQYYNTTIETKDTTVRGWNWGIAEVQSQDLAFLVAGKPAFTIPLSTVLNTSITKSEVALEFASQHPPPGANEEDALSKKKRLKALPDEVCEMRFYLPGSAKGMKKKERKAKVKAEGGGDDAKMKNGDGDDEDESDEDDDDEDSDEDGENGESAAQVFHDAVKEKADIGQITGEALCTIPDVLCLTPRGRFDIDMHADFLRLKGKTYDYRISYTQVQKLFLLQKPDDIHSQFVVNIDPPIRQGQTRYPYLVMQFVKDEILNLEINADEETLRTKYEGNLQSQYDDPAHEVISILFRVLAQKKVTTSGNFQSHEGQSAVKCNVKANEGQLYFLEKQLLFISKQPTLVLHSDIASVTFARVGGALISARTFDLSVRLKSDTDHSIIFSALNKEEQQAIDDFLRSKKIRVKNEMEELAAAEAAVLGDDDDDDDADDDDDDMEVDGSGNALREEDDEDSEVDEDFQADSDSDGGSGGSGSSDEDSDASEEEKPAKKKAKTS
ncbi:SSrecog-domain-containing protein [Meredithblackwellia eburnea MCA 4105]